MRGGIVVTRTALDLHGFVQRRAGRAAELGKMANVVDEYAGGWTR